MMDDFKQPTIEQSVYDEVERIVEAAMRCTTKKALSDYLQRLEWISKGLPTRAAYKISETASMLTCYCNRGLRAEQGKYRLAVCQCLDVLKGMVA